MIRQIQMIVILFIAFSCTEAQKTKSILLNATSFYDSLNNKKEIMLIDVRTPGEFNKGHIDKAVNIDWYAKDFSKQFETFSKSKPIYLYCLSGSRSSEAASKLSKAGYTVYDLDGGIIQWRAAKLPVTDNTVALTGNLSLEEYKKLVSGETPVLVDFYGEWCVPCRKMKPYIDELALNYKSKLKVVRISFDDNKELCDQLNINALPYLLYYKNGLPDWESKGLLSKEELFNKLNLN